MRTRTVVATLVVAALAGCASCDTVPADAVTDCSAQIVPGGAATDILFVIDDSGSMSQEQDELANNLGAFIDGLLGSAISLDVRVGVTNTSVEDYVASAGTSMVYRNAGFPGPAGTPYPGGTVVAIEQVGGAGQPGRFLWGRQYDDPAFATSTWGGPRILSSAAGGVALARDFKANVKQGTWGASREQPLAAMRKALEKASCPGPNCGFLRAGARLAVVILTDEDDCSGPLNPAITTDGTSTATANGCRNPANWGLLDPLADFVDYLDTVVAAGEPQKPIVALIAGFDADGVTSVCRGTTFGTTTSAAWVPTRLDGFMNLIEPGPVRARTLKASICQEFAPTLLAIASRIIPQTMPLRQAPADYRMMAVSVQRAGATVGCRLEPAGSGAAASADVVYTPAPAGGEPTLTFQNACRLGLGDKVDLRIVCVR